MKLAKNLFSRLSIMLWLILILQPDLYSQNIYVSSNGNNNNTGYKVTEPLKSINRAIEMASAGDTIYLLPGTYKEIVKFINKNGLPEKPICISGYADSENNYPLIDGGASEPKLNASSNWIIIENSHWIEIARIKFKNGWTYPIQIYNSSYISFDQCKFWGGKRVISAFGADTHHLLVENCFWDQGGEYLWKIEKDSEGIDAWTSMHHGNMNYFNGSLIDFNGTGGSIVIRKNTIINAFNGIRFRGVEGFDSNIEIYDNHVSNIRDNDFEPEYYTYNLHIYHNFSHNIHKTLSVDNVEGGQIYYYGNVITSDNDPWSVQISAGFWKIYGSRRILSYPIYAFNNSFFGVGYAFVNARKQFMRLLKHYNNAYFFSIDNGWDLNIWDSTDDFDYDISNKEWPANIIDNKKELRGKICDVKFVDGVNRNLKLQSGSPGIDAGKILSFKEFDWTQPYEGKAPDVGAYENGKLVQGPPFRYLAPPKSKIEYKEKPRIVRNYIDGNKIIIYFSDKIDTTSVKKEFVSMYKGREKLNAASVSFPKNIYQLVIETNAIPNDGDLSISFSQMPKGLNGETATYWASTIKIHKSNP